MLVWLTRSAAVATFQEKGGKRDIRLGYLENGGGGREGTPISTTEE